MSLTKQFATNKEAEIEGVEVTFSPNEDGTVPTFVVSRASRSNPRYLKALERLTKPHRRAIELKTLSREMSEDIFRQVFVDGNMMAWENVPLSDVTGEEKDTGYAPFSRANAIALLTRLPDLYDELQAAASDASRFRNEILEEEAGN